MANLRVPEPNYDRDVNRLIRTYKAGIKDITQRVTLLATYGEIDQFQAQSLLAQITFTLRGLDAETQAWTEATITKAFGDGQARTILALGEAKTLAEAASLASFSMLARDTLEALIADTYSDLLFATQNTDRKVKALVRRVVAEQMRNKAVQQLGRETMRKAVVSELTKKGLTERFNAEAWVGIVDKAGRRWNLNTYAEMVVRTKLNQAHVEGTRVESLERDVDLAIVSSHGAKDPCRHFEGMVISLNGLTPGYRTYEELYQSGLIFHPNCKHKVTPLRSPDLLPKDVRSKAEDQAANAKKI